MAFPATNLFSQAPLLGSSHFNVRDQSSCNEISFHFFRAPSVFVSSAPFIFSNSTLGFLLLIYIFVRGGDPFERNLISIGCCAMAEPSIITAIVTMSRLSPSFVDSPEGFSCEGIRTAI